MNYINRKFAETIYEMGTIRIYGIGINICLLHNSLENKSITIADHSHSTHEFTIVTEGKMTYRFNRRPQELGKGEIIFIPANTPHTRHSLGGQNVLTGFMLDFKSFDKLSEVFLKSFPALLRKSQYRFHDDGALLGISSQWQCAEYWDKPLALVAARVSIEQFIVCFFQKFFGDELTVLQKRAQKVKPTSQQFVHVVKDYIDERIEKPLRLEETAQHFNITSGHFNRLFKKATGNTFNDYVLNEKVEIAKKVLLDGNKIVKTIASELSFTDSAHFCRVFKQRTGMTPLQYSSQRKSFFVSEPLKKHSVP